MMTIVLGTDKNKPQSFFAPISTEVVYQGHHFDNLRDIPINKPCVIVTQDMKPSTGFYAEANKSINDRLGIIYGDYVTIQKGYPIVRLNKSYKMGVPCVPLLGSLVSPSFFYQIVDFVTTLKTCDISTKLDPQLSFFADCCPQHWAGVSFSL